MPEPTDQPAKQGRSLVGFYVALGVVAALVGVGVWLCRRSGNAAQTNQSVPTVVLAASATGCPCFAHEGFGMLSYRSNLYEFSFELSTGQGRIKGQGKFTWKTKDSLQISIKTECEGNAAIKLLGFSELKNLKTDKETSEILSVRPGHDKIEIERFCLQRYK